MRPPVKFSLSPVIDRRKRLQPSGKYGSALLGALLFLYTASISASESEPNAYHGIYQLTVSRESGQKPATSHTWQLYRGPGWLYLDQQGQPFAEMWQQNDRSVHYQQVFVAQKFIISYPGGDQTMLGQRAQFPRGAGLIDPGWLALPSCESASYQVYNTTCYEGQGVELVWIEALGLPARARWQSAGQL